MMLFEGHIIVVVMLILGFSLAIIVTQQQRSPQSTLAWLLAFVLLPYAAIPLFLLLGFRNTLANGAVIDFGGSACRSNGTASPLEDVFAAAGLPPAMPGHSFTLLDTPHAAHDAIFKIIGDAQRELWISFYIISKDPEGRAFLASLTDKARAGIKVYLLIDWFGAFAAPRGAMRAFKRAGGNCATQPPRICCGMAPVLTCATTAK
jgi:cardiolipin synthase